MVFAFSKDNHYSHYSLNFVLLYNKQYGGEIQIEILSDQALIYDDLIDSSDVFYSWYNVLWKLKKEFPSNKIIENLPRRVGGSFKIRKQYGKLKKK